MVETRCNHSPSSSYNFDSLLLVVHVQDMSIEKVRLDSGKVDGL